MIMSSIRRNRRGLSRRDKGKRMKGGGLRGKVERREK